MWLLGFIVAVFLNTGVHTTLLGRSNYNIVKALSIFLGIYSPGQKFWALCLSCMKTAIGRSLWAMGSSKPLFQREAECEAIDMKMISCK